MKEKKEPRNSSRLSLEEHLEKRITKGGKTDRPAAIRGTGAMFSLSETSSEDTKENAGKERKIKISP